MNLQVGWWSVSMAQRGLLPHQLHEQILIVVEMQCPEKMPCEPSSDEIASAVYLLLQVCVSCD